MEAVQISKVAWDNYLVVSMTLKSTYSFDKNILPFFIFLNKAKHIIKTG